MRNEVYNFILDDFIILKVFKTIKEFSKDKETPLLIVDLARIGEKYDELVRKMPFVKTYYAMKANPLDEVLLILKNKGSCFDAGTVYEIDRLLDLGVDPEKISFGNTIKKEKDIEHAFKKGIRLFATDSDSDVKKIAKRAPGPKVFFRLLTESDGADWPLSRKFGAHPDMIHELIVKARELELEPYGLSFHVGSQQCDIGQWDNALSKCKYLFEVALQEGIQLKMINIGGGFPASYLSPANSIGTYAKEILRFIKEDFGENHPEIIIEPGRSLTADAGIIVTEVVMISKKSKLNQYKWVYVDIGKFGGLMETIDECIKYPIYSEKEGNGEEVIIVGPTCDSMDILYEDHKYVLPDTLKEGDHLYIFTTGAYTQSYSSVSFNGIPPLKAYVI